MFPHRQAEHAAGDLCAELLKPSNHGTHPSAWLLIEWFIGDHDPRHVHVYDAKGGFMGRLNLNTLIGHEGWNPDKKLLKLITELQKQGRL